MKIFGIRFAPLNVPMERRLQTLAAGAWFITMAFGSFVGLLLAVYLILFTRLWWLTLLYIIWMWKIDLKVAEKGGRPIEWVRNWTWWKYFRDYFPIRLKCVDGYELDPERNYLFCCFPHGMLSAGPFNAFGTNIGGYPELFPNHKANVITLSQHYAMPFFREFALSLGGCASSATSIDYILSRPGGGRIVVLMPGGAAESYYCRPGQYQIVLKKRKGFIKLALKNGTPLVPVFSFGEIDLFTQFNNPEGSRLRRFQDFLRKYIGVAPVIPLGRGFFQYSFGLIPQRKPVTTVVGKPIEVQKIEQPTKDQIEELHEKFMESINNLFEEQKYLYLEKPEENYLIIE